MFTPRFAVHCLVSLLLSSSALAAQTAPVPVPVPTIAAAQATLSALAVPFVPNVGQWDKRAAFKASTLGGALFVTTDGAMVYSFPGKPIVADTDVATPHPRSHREAPERGPGWALTETLVDANGNARPLKPAGLGPNETKVSYFTADNSTKNDQPINTYHRVQMGEVYPGVNLQLRATGNNMEKIFTVAPGHNPAQIQVQLDGAERLSINPDGQLVAHTGNGPISFTAPIAFQEDARGNRDGVTVAYALNNDGNRYGFTLGAFDATRPLIIDPLLQSTYLGGTSYDTIRALAVHPISGEVLVAGYTDSINLPGTPGGAQAASGGGTDGFVSRFNAALTTQLQSTYLGGAGDDFITAMAVHPISGEVLVAGYTNSINLPGTTGGAQPASGGGYDGFVSRLNAALTTRLQSTYLGGTGDDVIYALAVHPISGEVLLAGYTSSINLPGTAGGAQPASGGGH